MPRGRQKVNNKYAILSNDNRSLLLLSYDRKSSNFATFSLYGCKILLGSGYDRDQYYLNDEKQLVNKETNKLVKFSEKDLFTADSPEAASEVFISTFKEFVNKVEKFEREHEIVYYLILKQSKDDIGGMIKFTKRDMITDNPDAYIPPKSFMLSNYKVVENNMRGINTFVKNHIFKDNECQALITDDNAKVYYQSELKRVEKMKKKMKEGVI